MRGAPSVHIGTSGWQYREFHRIFYPPGLKPTETLRYYCKQLDAVEINSSFYGIPKASSFERWRDVTPPEFRFALKANRVFTHRYRLEDPLELLPPFLKRARLLGPRLGPILFQLPASFEENLAKLASFLEQLPRGARYVFELRHPSWWQSATWRLLERFEAAFCIHDIHARTSPLAVTTDFAYVRLHGPLPTPYTGAYRARALESWAEKIQAWKRETYLFFDNTAQGAAITDALFAHELFEMARKAA
jgi:uncharacterized protein YecE (DUF72 family)